MVIKKFMPVVNRSELINLLGHEQRLIGIDLGTKTIGLALSDVRRTIATPMRTILRKKFSQDAQELFSLIDAESVGGIVLGLPVEMSGNEGKRSQSTRQFARNILAIRNIPLLFHDERLSTAAINRMLIENDTSRQRRDQLVDKLAAAYILQGAIDALNSTPQALG